MGISQLGRLKIKILYEQDCIMVFGGLRGLDFCWLEVHFAKGYVSLRKNGIQ